MDSGKNTSLYLFAAIIVLLINNCSAQDNVAVVGSFQYTNASAGFGYGTVEDQSSRPSLGGGVEYRKGWGANGISADWNVASTDAEFTNVAAIYDKLQWGMVRHEINGGYVRT